MEIGIKQLTGNGEALKVLAGAYLQTGTSLCMETDNAKWLAHNLWIYTNDGVEKGFDSMDDVKEYLNGF